MAFDWIESHRGLRDHPKTVTLAAVWADRKTCVIGHLHELWWWTLEYAPGGVIRPAFFPQVVQACEWHGRPEKFWSGLLESGFLESMADTDTYVVHDWDEYAAKRIERHEKTQARKQAWRDKAGRPAEREKVPDATSGATSGKPDATSGATSPTRARYQPDQQGLRPLPDQPQTPLPPDVADGLDADAQGAPPTASAPNIPPQWEEIAPGQHRGTPNGQGEVSLLTARCPRCERSMPVAEVENHDCQLVVGEPVQTPPARRRGGRGLHRVFEASDTVPPEVRAELERMERERPTPEQIAAEVARIGQQPR